MAELTRGTVFDRPWGRTLGALGLRGLTGQLTLTGVDGKAYSIAFSNGAVIGAYSPIASDAAVRVALTGGLVSTTQVSDLARKQAADPKRDDVDVIAEHLKLDFNQAMRLRRRTIAQRAARTFSVDKGEFVVVDKISLSTVAGSELDIRSVIYLGARQNLSEARLAAELGLFGTWFRLKPEAFEDLPQFGFGEAERPIVDQLLNGASLGDLEGIIGIDVRTVRATLYALCAANACNVEQARGQGTTKPPPPTMRASDPGLRRGSDPGVRRTPPHSSQPPTQPAAPVVAAPPAGAPREKRATAQPLVAYRPGMPRRSTGKTEPPANTTATLAPQASRTTTPPPQVSRSTTPPPSRTTTPPPSSRTTTPPPSRTMPPPRAATSPPTNRPASSHSGIRVPGGTNPPPTLAVQTPEVQQLIAQKAKLLEQGADHYQMLGLGDRAPADEIRKMYFGLARQLHPDRLTALGIDDTSHIAHKVFAQLNTAFSILSDSRRRVEYDQLLGRGGEAAVRNEQARAEELAMRIMEAEEAYKRGEMALKRDDLGNAIAELEKAIALNPDEPDFLAAHAWAMFCAAPDKNAVARHTRAALQKAIERSPRAINPRFYLGRVERMLGRDKEALTLFRDVLLDKPHHFDAQSEVRAIEQRLQGGGGRKR